MMDLKEIWKPVVGFEGYYEISSIGNLKRLAGDVPLNRNGYKFSSYKREEKILKSHLNHKGYYHNSLFNFDGGVKNRFPVLIHRLVALAFLGEHPEGKEQVNHKNGIKTDNHYSNLEWCNNSENQTHARKSGLRPENKKGWDYKGSMPVIQINLSNGEIINTFGSFEEAQRETGIDARNMRKVCNGLRKNAGGYFWKKL
jgi:hypothetical protein